MRSCFAALLWLGAAGWLAAPAVDVRHRRRAEPGEYGLRERPTIH